ncbi:MAG: LCP family protein [Nocardioidaceae bacterium]
MSDDDLPTEGGDAASPDAARAADGTGGPTPPTKGGRGRATKRKNFLRRHILLTSLATVLLVLMAAAGGFAWYLNHQLDNIPRVDAGIHQDPARDGHEADHPLNILLLGADHGKAEQSVEEDLKDGDWTPGEHLSDTIILVHIPADRDSAQVVSLPRDSWVKIPGYPYDVNGHAKINAAFSYGGPRLAVRTVEKLTHIPIDHMAMIDWASFKGLTQAVGGVRVYIPETFEDNSQDVTWKQGWHRFEGEKALQYVRTRHGLENGDFGRIQRQQNFLRTLMGKLLSSDTTHNPIKLTKILRVTTRYLVVDKTWDNGEIRNLALSLRKLKAGDVRFMTAPLGSYDSVEGQSIVRLDQKRSQQLFRAIRHDDIQSYLDKYPNSGLPGDKSIN